MEKEKRIAIEQLIQQQNKEIALLHEMHDAELSKVKKSQWVS